MMPDNELSSVPVPYRFVGARSLGITKTIDYEDGGIAIRDPSQGLNYQRWRARLFNAGKEDSYVVLDAREVPETVVLEEPYIEEFSFTFDQNMQPMIAYVVGGNAYFRWYDTTIEDFTVTDLGAVLTPRVFYDDKRFLGSEGYQRSDVILGYVRDGNLYMRMQRDRYEDEYLLAEDVNPLIKIGFTRGLRVQFMHEIL